MVIDYSLFTDHDIYLFREGTHFSLYDKFGSHPLEIIDPAEDAPKGKKIKGTYFAVWAPNADHVSVIGDFNGWEPGRDTLKARWDQSGVWEGFIPGIGHGTKYKYHIASRFAGYNAQKTDPFARWNETPPKTASIVWDMNYNWSDDDWMKTRRDKNGLDKPMSVYEVHIGSWRRVPEDGNRGLGYRELAHQLAEYAGWLGFTHVQFLPVMEHPFYGSWGYQTLGYFSPTSRYGDPQDFMYLVEHLHKNGIGVLLDWVPSHFPGDGHGLHFFDGTFLFEHADPKQGFHPDWNSYIFNYGRNEIRSILISSGLFWLKKYHADGLRVDAVASMLYLDYSRKHGEWVPNKFGGKENIEAIKFIHKFNEAVYAHCPDVQTIAEESTDWPMVSRPVYVGGLGFGMKWNMGWMHDTLNYFSKDPVFRKYHHNELTFSIWYAFTENFMLPLSHDEVVHGKGSLIRQMSGDYWQKFASLRSLYGYMWTHPGKKLLFMGGEFAQWNEWYHESSLDWNLTGELMHRGMMRWVQDLNHAYRSEPALYEQDFTQDGFEWIDFRDWESSIVSFIRRAKDGSMVLVICNFTPVPRWNYRVGVPSDGYWRELLNSDSEVYAGSGLGNFGGVWADWIPSHGKNMSINAIIPPSSTVVFKRQAQ